ncbi:UNVERIFIED_CONTAM: hypothetical protein FKN15_069499 [Acipenser sinensis]
MNTRCPPKRVPSATSFFTLSRLTVEPPQSYSVGGQRSSGQLTGKLQASLVHDPNCTNGCAKINHFYKQRWMVMMVDTAVTCPTDGTAFTEQMITWNVPRVLPPLVPTPQITTLDVQMGVDGRKLDPATIHNRDYKLDVGPQLITVKIPVGADGGYYKSHVLDNTYVISYSIEPMLENTWQDGPEKTKYTVLHPITTPFMPRPPVVTNNTVPKARVFNVTLGTFLPDVELVKIIVGPETLTVPEANLKGYNVQEHVFPNGSKTYTLQVPFEDPNVKQKVTPPDTRTYILPLTYLLNIVPENTPFTHPAVVEAILKDIIPPTVTGYCDGAAFYTMVTYGNMGRNWVPFVGSRELGGSLLALYKYNANATNFWMTVPYNSVDATYEVISSLGIRSRLDLTLKDIGTMVVVADFSLSCSFPTKMIDCFTNGTMAALAVKVESVPSLSPSQLTLRDPSCRPLQSDAINAVFYFNVNSCGTTRREKCWATYSADRNSSPKWDVVVDSCENSADEYLTIFHPVSSNARVLFPSHLKRFEVKMFSFISGQDALKGQSSPIMFYPSFLPNLVCPITLYPPLTARNLPADSRNGGWNTRPPKRAPAKPSFFGLQIHSNATRPIVPEDNTDLAAPLQNHRRLISHRGR